MIIITCVDDNMGMMFNHRRLSQDRVLRERVLQLTGGSRLWMNHYSAKQFESLHAPQINVDDDFMSQAVAGDFCFIEDTDIRAFKQWVEKIILFKWNRQYPSDQDFPIALKQEGWKLSQTEDFVGSSHNKITEENYTK